MFALSGMIFAGIILNARNQELSDTLVRIQYDELKEKIDNEESFILVYSSDTCANCQTYKPKLEEILLDNDLVAYEVVEQDYTTEEQIAFVKSIASTSGTPTTVFIKDGEEENTNLRIVGDKTKTSIIEALTKAGYINE